MNLEGARGELIRLFDDTDNRGRVPEHVLIHHSPTLWAKTLQSIIPQKEKHIRSALPERVGDLAAVLTHLRQGDILFLSQIHRLSETCTSVLVNTMANFVLHVESGVGPKHKEVDLRLAQFTVIGATSQPDLLSNSLKKAFSQSIWIDDEEDTLAEPQLN
jgi:Holliday junction DNA helicase RuvB